MNPFQKSNAQESTSEEKPKLTIEETKNEVNPTPFQAPVEEQKVPLQPLVADTQNIPEAQVAETKQASDLNTKDDSVKQSEPIIEEQKLPLQPSNPSVESPVLQNPALNRSPLK